MRLKVGITNTSFNVYGAEGRYEAIARSGYDSVDFQEFANIYSDFFRLPKKDFLAAVAAERKMIESYGLGVHQAHAPWVGSEPRDRTPEERAAWLVAMKKAIVGLDALEYQLLLP